MNNIAVILGAGSGTRMKSKTSKLLLEISGKTVIERAVEAFESAGCFNKILLVCRKQDVNEYRSMFSGKNIQFVIGGETRQKSVKNALRAIDEADYVAVHDGARPLIKKERIISALEEAKKCGAAAVGVKVKDTVKIIDKNGFVISTPERSSLFAVQTPQIFDFKLFKSAFEKAENDGKDFTDDCQIVEYIGGKVKMLEGDYTNIKITTPDDIPLAESIIGAEKGVLK